MNRMMEVINREGIGRRRWPLLVCHWASNVAVTTDQWYPITALQATIINEIMNVKKKSLMIYIFINPSLVLRIIPTVFIKYQSFGS